ncbi:hypothetical protein QTP70_035081, partial [Hemibagrus guttatus]
NKFCDVSPENFLLLYLLPSVFILLLLSFVERRQKICSFEKRFPCLSGRFGIVVPLDFTSSLENRWSYAFAFGAVTPMIFNLFFGFINPFPYTPPRYLNVLVYLVAALEVGVVCKPFFACLSTANQMLGGILGLLYTLSWLVFKLWDFIFCNRTSNYDANSFEAYVLQYDWLFGILHLLSMGFLLFRFGLIIVKDVLIRLKKIDKQKEVKKHQYRYVQRLLRGPAEVSVEKSWFQRKVYEWDPYFKFPNRIIATVVLCSFGMYMIVLTEQITSSWCTRYLYKIWPDFIEPNLHYIPAISGFESLWTMHLNYITYTWYITSVCAAVSSVIHISHVLVYYRKHIKSLWAGDKKYLPKNKLNSAVSVAGLLKYPGYQIAFTMWGYLIVHVAIFTIGMVFVYLVISPIREYGFHFWLLELTNFLTNFFIVFALMRFQRIIIKIFFLQDKNSPQDKLKPLALNNRLARQRDRDGKDVQQVRVIKDRDGRVLTSEESVQRRWKEYFEELMNEENDREKRVEGVNSVEQKVDKIRKDEVRKALKRMKSGKAVGPDDIPVEVWKCLGEAAVEFLTSLFNRVLESEKMPEEWRRSVLVPIFKNKGDVQSCSNYRGIKLMSHTMKLWERVVEARLRKVVEICEQQYGFMPRKSTTDAIFALRILMEKYRDGQRELHCVFVDLEKAYDRVPREELWCCMRKSGVAEKYVRVVQDMYERSRTVVRCAVGQTEEFKVEVGLHQGSALSPFLFAIVMDQLSEEVRQESPWTMMFADDIVICSESREQVEENLERWRFALERRGMKVSGSKTEYMCVNEREGSGTVRLQGEEVKKVQEFKYLGSTVQSNGESGKEVKKRVQAGWNGGERKIFHNFNYYLFFFNMILGLGSCVLRVIRSAVVALMLLARIERSIMPQGFKKLDTSHSTWLGMIITDHYHNNPVLVCFCHLLLKHTLQSVRVDEGVKPAPPAKKRARLRWVLVYTLLRNPELILLRKRRWHSNKEALELAFIWAMTRHQANQNTLGSGRSALTLISALHRSSFGSEPWWEGLRRTCPP